MADEEEEEEVAHNVANVAVVNGVFCVPELTELVVKKRLNINAQSRSTFEVLDSSQTLLLQIEGRIMKLHRKFLMKGALGSPLLTLREAAIADKHRWDAYRGKSKEEHDLVFKVQRTRHVQLRTRLDVFLAGNHSSDVGNFHMSQNLTSRSFVLYEGTKLIAQANHKVTWKSVVRGKDTLKLKICKGVDYAFVVALLVVMFMMNERI